MAVPDARGAARLCDHTASDLGSTWTSTGWPRQASRELILARPKGAATQHLPATVHRTDGETVRVHGAIPLRLLAPAQGEQAGENGSEWDLYVAAGGQERMRVAFPVGQAEYQYPAGHQEIAVERTRDGNTAIAAARCAR